MTDVSIAALRAFRSLALCGSFTAAARDRGCAQSAISRHVATLEAHTQQALVVRGHRKIRLTPAGDSYLQSVERALDELDQGAVRLGRASEARPAVRLLVMPSFASRWLIPRLRGLAAAGIDVDIELNTSIWDSEFLKERYDLAIHYGDGSMPGSQLLMQDRLVPVASPALLGGRRLARLEDLQLFPWLHTELRASKWPRWLEACQASGLSGSRQMRLQDTNNTLTAAVAGLGIAMGHDVLVEHDLREGRLVEAWSHHVSLSAGYHLLQSKRSQRNAGARALAAWLIREAAAFRNG